MNLHVYSPFCGGKEAIVRQQDIKGTIFLVHRKHLYRNTCTRLAAGNSSTGRRNGHTPNECKIAPENENGLMKVTYIGIALHVRGIVPAELQKVSEPGN